MLPHFSLLPSLPTTLCSSSPSLPANSNPEAHGDDHYFTLALANASGSADGIDGIVIPDLPFHATATFDHTDLISLLAGSYPNTAEAGIIARNGQMLVHAAVAT